MMVKPLIDLKLVRAHCRVDSGAEDALLGAYLEGALQAAQDYMNRKVYADQAELDAAMTTGSAGENPMVINGAVQSAILLLTGHLYANREENVIGTNVSELKTGAYALLRPHRIVNGF